MKPLYTIGYQRLPLSKLVEIVAELEAELVDVRLYPRSSWNADYNRSNLETVFKGKYVWKGDVLGGFKHTSSAGIRWIKKELERTPLILMCVESDPLDCHRHHAICAPYFSDALHIIDGQDRIRAGDLKPDSLF